MGVFQGGAHVRRPPQWNGAVGIDRHEQSAQGTGALRLRQTMGIKGFLQGAGSSRLAPDPPRRGVDPARYCLQQLACSLEVAPPKQCRAFGSEPESGIGSHAIVGNDYPGWRRHASGRAPACAAALVVLAPDDQWKIAHRRNRRQRGGKTMQGGHARAAKGNFSGMARMIRGCGS